MNNICANVLANEYKEQGFDIVDFVVTNSTIYYCFKDKIMLILMINNIALIVVCTVYTNYIFR